jgi:intein/homing endonuclease
MFVIKMKSLKNTFKKVKQELILPVNFDEKLAEETGIHIGDGCMNIYQNYNHNVYVYSGHALDDLAFSNYVKNLMKDLYNLYPSYERIQKNTIMLSYTRKELVKFKQKLGLNLGHKDKIEIPAWIMKNKYFKRACLKGIFATDGSLLFQKKYKNFAYYPRLRIDSKSEKLIKQIKTILDEVNINSSISCDKRITVRHPSIIWGIYIYGTDNLEKFVMLIGFSNQKHLVKYEMWKKKNAGDDI